MHPATKQLEVFDALIKDKRKRWERTGAGYGRASYQSPGRGRVEIRFSAHGGVHRLAADWIMDPACDIGGSFLRGVKYYFAGALVMFAILLFTAPTVSLTEIANLHNPVTVWLPVVGGALVSISRWTDHLWEKRDVRSVIEKINQ